MAIAQVKCPCGNLPDPSCWLSCYFGHICFDGVSSDEAVAYYSALYPDAYDPLPFLEV